MSPNKQQLLNGIHPGMKLDKAFFLKVYGYEISFPGFADEAIQKLEEAGCSKAKEYYDMTVSEYEQKRDEGLRPIAKQIRKCWETDFDKLEKGSEERRRQEMIQHLHRKSDRELLNLLQNMN